jgi:hypothetical protein
VLLFVMYWFRRRHTRTIFNSMRIYEIPTIFLSTEQHLIYLQTCQPLRFRRIILR